MPTAEHTSDPQALASMQQGRELYIARCASCHNLYKPQTYSPAVWSHQMEEMKLQAQITEEQASLILSYLTAYQAKEK